MPMDHPRLASILLVGSDISLASSRANLLIQAGHTVDLEVNVERALGRNCTTPYDLVVVCNKFSRAEQADIRARLKQTRPEQQVLLLGHCEDDPATFLESVSTCFRLAAKRSGLGHAVAAWRGRARPI